MTLTKSVVALASANRFRPATQRNVYEIQRITADVFGIESRELFGPRKPYNIATARHVAMFLCRVFLRSMTPGRLDYPLDYPTIAEHFGRGHHGSVMYAVSSIRDRTPLEQDLASKIVSIRERLELSLSS